jgi:hypothetical protein
MGTLARPLESHVRLPPDAARSDIGDQLVDEIWTRSRSSLPMAALVLLVAWPLVRTPASESRPALVAYVALQTTTIGRWGIALWAIPRLDKLPPALKWWLGLAGTLASGCAFGVLNVLVYLHSGALDLGLWITIVTGLTGGAAVSLGARPEMFAAYAVPTIAAMIVATLVWPRAGITPLTICWSLWILYSLVQVKQYRQTRV